MDGQGVGDVGRGDAGQGVGLNHDVWVGDPYRGCGGREGGDAQGIRGSDTRDLANAKWTAFIQRFSNQWPLKSALQCCRTFTHSCTHSHANNSVNHARLS